MALELKKKPKSAKKGDGADEPVKVSKKVQAEMDRPFVAALPMVNLLSSEVQEVVEHQRLKRLFLILGGGVLVAIVAVWLLQAGMIAVAKGKLEDEQAKSTELNAKQAALAPVQMFYGQVEANRSTIQTTMANEVLTSQVLSRLDSVTPAGITINTIGVTLESAAASGEAVAVDPTATTGTCPSQDPYSPAAASAGCVTVDGSATSREVLGTWLDNIEADDEFTVAFIPTTTSDAETGGVTFSATIGLDAEAAYTNRYADPEFLKAGAN